MTDSQTPANDEGTENTEDQEKSFWDKLSALIDARVDAGVERAVKKYTGPRQSRNGGRSTIPGYLADFMYGPAKTKDE